MPVSNEKRRLLTLLRRDVEYVRQFVNNANTIRNIGEYGKELSLIKYTLVEFDKSCKSGVITAKDIPATLMLVSDYYDKYLLDQPSVKAVFKPTPLTYQYRQWLPNTLLVEFNYIYHFALKAVYQDFRKTIRSVPNSYLPIVALSSFASFLIQCGLFNVEGIRLAYKGKEGLLKPADRCQLSFNSYLTGVIAITKHLEHSTYNDNSTDASHFSALYQMQKNLMVQKMAVDKKRGRRSEWSKYESKIIKELKRYAKRNAIKLRSVKRQDVIERLEDWAQFRGDNFTMSIDVFKKIQTRFNNNEPLFK